MATEPSAIALPRFPGRKDTGLGSARRGLLRFWGLSHSLRFLNRVRPRGVHWKTLNGAEVDSEHHHHQSAPHRLATAGAKEQLPQGRKMSFRWVGGRRDAGGGIGSCQIREGVSSDEQSWVGVDPWRQQDLVGWGRHAHDQVLPIRQERCCQVF